MPVISMNPSAVDVIVLDNYKLKITFENNEIRIFDAAPYLGYPIFKRLQNEGYFSLAKIGHGTVMWSDVIDFSPDIIYLESTRVTL